MEVLFILSKKHVILLLLVCIVGISTLSFVSATDLNETGVETDGIEDEMLSGSEEEINMDDSLHLTPSGNTFKDIQNTINIANDSDTIILNGTYAYSGSQIDVNKQIHFIGRNNATLIGIEGTRIFEVKSSGVTFTNITFRDTRVFDYGGSVYSQSYEFVCENCIFINSTARNGGALYNGKAVNCTFIENEAIGSSWGHGGAMWRGTAINSTFIRNSASSTGGALFETNAINCTFMGNSASNGGVLDGGFAFYSNFINNSAYNSGGALYYGRAYNCNFSGNAVERYSGGAVYEGDVYNCCFIGNSAKEDGGAIHGKYSIIVNCTFTDNSAGYGGAIYSGSAVNSTFINNSAKTGGAIYIDTSYVTIDNCQFINCSSNERGSAVYWQDATDITITNSIFNNCKYNGDLNYALYCINSIDYWVCDCLFDAYPININYHYTSILISEDTSIDRQGKRTLAVNLSNILGFLSDKLVTFAINGQNFTQYTDAQGLISFNITNYFTEIGKYDVSISFAGDEINNPVLINTTVFITYSTLLSEDLNIFMADDGILMANLSDTFGPLSGKTIAFYINGYVVNSTTDENGVALLNSSKYLTESGKYDVNISFYGDRLGIPAFSNATIVKNKYDSILKVDELFMTKGQGGSLTINLSDVRGPLSLKSIIIKLNGKTYSRLTNSEGIAIFDIGDSLSDFGKYGVNVSFSGDKFDNPSSANTNIYVNLFNGILTVNQSGKYYHDTYLNFKLINIENNETLAFIPFDVVVSNGQTVHLATDSQGVCSYKFDFEPGLYNITAMVTTPYSNVKVINLTDFEIFKLTGVIELNHTEHTKILNIKLVNDATGDVYKNVKVHLKFSDGWEDDITTNDEGIARYNMPLAIGTYSVIASVSEDFTEFDDSQLNDIVISAKEKSSVIFDRDIVFDYLEYGFTNITVIGGIVELENISVLYHPEAIINLTDNNTIYVSGLDAGDYKLQVITTPDEDHLSYVGTVDVIVNKLYSSVEFSDCINFDYLESDTINITVYGGYVVEDNITVDGQPEAIINLTGNVLTVSCLDAGNYTLRVLTTPDKNHIAKSECVSVEVNKISSSIGFDNNELTFNYLDSGFIKVFVNGGSVNNENITLLNTSKGDVSITGDIITVSGLDVGNYTLRANVTPDKNYYPSYATLPIIINRINSEIDTSGDIVFYYLGSGSTFLNLTGCTVRLSNVSVIDHDEAELSISNDNVLTVSGLTAGNYTLSITSTPDENHYSVTRFVNVTVNKLKSVIQFSADSISFDYLGSGSISVYVEGGSVKREDISVDGYPKTPIDFKSGIIYVSGLNVGKYFLRVKSTPDENHSASEELLNITVNNIAAKVKASSMSVYYKSSKTLAVTLTNSKTGAPLVNMKVSIDVYTNGKYKTYNAVTNSKGIATFKTSAWAVGSHKIVISFTKYGYSCKSLTVTVKVLKTTKLTFIAKPKAETAGSKMYVYTKIGKNFKNGIKLYMYVYTDKKYKPFTLITGNYKENGKSYKGFVGYITNTLSVGSHKVIVKPVSDKYSGSITTKMVIKKSAKKFQNTYSLISNGKKTGYRGT